MGLNTQIPPKLSVALGTNNIYTRYFLPLYLDTLTLYLTSPKSLTIKNLMSILLLVAMFMCKTAGCVTDSIDPDRTPRSVVFNPDLNYTYDAQRTKRALMQFAANRGPDQPAHSRRLIRAFVAHLQNR